MRIDTGQHLRMDQRMKLAPRMIQSMEILQMAQAALEERIEQELASNPTLELEDPSDAADDIAADLQQEARDARENERELVVTDNGEGQNADDFERLSNLAEEYSDDWKANATGSADDFSTYHAAANTGERDKKMDAMANTAARSASLYDQLLDQWHLVDAPPRIAEAGEYLIGFIDNDGYLRTDPKALLDQAPHHLTAEDLEQAIDLLQQSLEPPGLAARDLRECLLLQIDARRRADPDADLSTERLLVADHLKDIEANRLPRIARTTGLTIEQITHAIHHLRQFQPHPGRQLADDTPRAITPDAIVEYDEQADAYVAHLTHGRTPNLQISADYTRIASEKSTDKKTRDFLGGQLRNARWLIDAIEQRSSTLLRVINVVLTAQRDFFDLGPQALKPLPMTQVADQLGIHVATVSRAVNEKYLQTPRGIFPLRMFFSGGAETEDGQSMAWAAIQARLEEVINAEDKSNPLSDEALVEELKKKGIDIARRTIAKYRKQLNIPSARQRREY